MELRRAPVSTTVTRYYVSAHLGPTSRLMLVRPSDGLIVTSWSTSETPCVISGEWVSPFPDLEALVAGEELGSVTVTPTLRAATVVPPAIDRRTQPPLAS